MRTNISAKTTEADRAKFYASTNKNKAGNSLRGEVFDKLPSNYYDYIDLFNREAAYELPPYRLGLDHEIKLLPSS